MTDYERGFTDCKQRALEMIRDELCTLERQASAPMVSNMSRAKYRARAITAGTALHIIKGLTPVKEDENNGI